MHVPEQIVCATGAGCASTLVGHPLDTIKVHLQTNPKLGTGSSYYSAIQQLLFHDTNSPRNGGVHFSYRVLFRGMGPPLVNAIVMNTVMFGVFAECAWMGPMSAGLVSGITTAFVSTPTDYCKIQAQLHNVSSARVFQDALLGRSGASIKTLFRGHVANLGREGVFTMVYLGLYNVLMQDEYVPLLHSRNSNGDFDDHTSTRAASSNELSLWKVAAISSVTGGLAWVVSYPFDTVKTVMQGSSSRAITLRQAVQGLWNEHQGGGGRYRAFYRGCGASTGRAVLVTSIRMITYEWILGFF